MSQLSLNSRVEIAISGEHGLIIATMQSLEGGQTYRVHYQAKDGSAQTEWFYGSQLRRVSAQPTQAELPLTVADAANSLKASGKAVSKALEPAPSKTSKRKPRSFDERLSEFVRARPNRYNTTQLATRFKVTYWVMRSTIKRNQLSDLVVRQRAEVAA